MEEASQDLLPRVLPEPLAPLVPSFGPPRRHTSSFRWTSLPPLLAFGQNAESVPRLRRGGVFLAVFAKTAKTRLTVFRPRRCLPRGSVFRGGFLIFVFFKKKFIFLKKINFFYFFSKSCVRRALRGRS